MQYQAFISYSHAANGRLAPALQRGLHRFARPWNKLRALTAFRDQTDLSVSPGLWSKIAGALERSEYLLLLCSPSAAGSQWVAREIEFWLRHRSPDTILLIQAEGQIVWSDAKGGFDESASDALPPGLQGVFTEEPFFLDLRWTRDEENLDLGNPRFLEAVASIAATVRGEPKNQLIGQDVKEHRRALRLAWSAVVTLSVLLVATVIAANFAVQGQREAARQRDIALARQLNAQSELARSRGLDQLPLSTLLVVESLKHVPSVTADQTLHANLSLLPKPLVSFHVEAARWTPGVFSQDGQLFLMQHADGRFVLLDVNNQGILGQWEGEGYTEPRMNRDKTHFAVVARESIEEYSDTLFQAVVRELSTGEVVARVPHRQGMSGYALSPTARYLAFRRLNDLTIWDIGRGQEAHNFQHGASVRSFEFSPDEASVAVSTAGGHYLWNLSDGTTILRASNGESADVTFLNADVVAFLTAKEPAVVFYDTDTGEEIVRTGLDGVSRRLELSPTEGLVGVQDNDGRVVIRNVDDFSEQVRVSLSEEDSSFLGFSEDGLLFATTGQTATQIWDSRTGRELARISEELNRPILSLAWGRAGHRLSVIAANRISVFEPDLHPSAYMARHGGQVRAVAFSPDGRFFASGGWDKSLQLWNIAEEKAHAHIFLGGLGGIEAAEFTADGRYLVAGMSDGTLLFFDSSMEARQRIEADDGSEVPYLTREQAAFTLVTGARLRDLSLSASGDLVAATEGGLQAWSIDARQQVEAPLIEGDVYAATFDPSGQVMATGEGQVEADEGTIGGANQARIWDWPRRRARLSLPHDGPVSLVAFSPDGRYLATASRSTVRVWEARSGELTHELTHERPVNDVVFDRAGERLFTGSGPPIVRAGPHLITIWDLATGTELKRIGHEMAVFDVALSPDESYIASACMDGYAYLWSWRRQDVLEEACRRLPRNLTPTEWERYLAPEPYRETCPGLPVVSEP